MNSVQRLIKYLAIAFAFLLIFGILSSIIECAMSLDKAINKKDNEINFKDLGLEDISILDIDIGSTNLIIKEGDSFKAETNNKSINCKQDNNKLFIKEKKKNWFNFDKDNDLIVYIPSYMVLDNTKIEGGVGKITIEKLSTKELSLSLGAGKVMVNNLRTLKETDIDGGAGEIIITNSDITKLDLDMGVGKTKINAKLNGNNKIDGGVGSLNLNLIGKEDDYRITLDKGIGSAYLKGNNMIDKKTYGDGDTILDVDGGIGNININITR